ENIATVRTFIAAGYRLENRAVFTGEESPDQIDAVLAHFADHASNCVIEVNPASHYVDPPKSWEQRLLKHLLSRHCYIDGFRCVWVRAEPPIGPPSLQHRWQRFTGETLDEFIALATQVQTDYAWPVDRRVIEL